MTSNQRKTDEVRVRTLQRALMQRNAENKTNDSQKAINIADLIVLIVGSTASISVFFAAREINLTAIGVLGLVIIFLPVIKFFITDKYDRAAVRLILGFYALFYLYMLFAHPIALTVYPFVAFSYPAFAFTMVGGREAFTWSMIVTLAFGFGGIYDIYFAEEPVIGGNTLIVILSSLITISLLTYVLDQLTGIITKDIAKQKQQLESSNAQYDVVLNSVGDGLIATDKDGIIEFASHAGLELLGLKRDDIIGQPLTSVVYIQDSTENVLRAFEHPLTHVLKTGKAVVFNRASEQKFSFIKADQSTFPAGFSITPISIMGQVTGAIMLFHDISEEEQIDRAKSEFVSLASHQLRTPLNVVSWYTEKLQKGKGGELNEKGEQYLDEIYTNNRRMIDLVSAILNVSRIDLGRLQLSHEEIEIIGLIKELVKEIKPLCEKKNIKLSANYSVESYKLFDNDKEHATVVVQNLLSNAMKYTPDNGSIKVLVKDVPANEHLNEKFSITTNDKGILVTVADTGIGIPYEQQEHIFGKLFRADNAQSQAVDGTGLGLYVTKSLVERLGGNIWFESKPNEGTTFYVFLPARENTV